MDTSVWLRVMAEAERAAKGRAQQWLVDRLSGVSDAKYTIQRVQNWKSRGIPKGEYPTIAAAIGKTIDWVAGVEIAERSAEPRAQPSLLSAVGVIAGHMEHADDMTREAIAPLLARLANSPADAPRILRMIEAMLASAPESAGQDAPTYAERFSDGHQISRDASQPVDQFLGGMSAFGNLDEATPAAPAKKREAK